MTEPRPALLTRGFALVFAVTFLTFFAAFQLFPTVPLHLRSLGASLAESGRFMSAFTAGSALGALVTGPLADRFGPRRMVMAGAAGFALFLLAYGLVPVRWPIYVLAFPHGVVWSGLLTATMATLGHVLPADRRADGLSLYGLASPGGVVFGPMVGLWSHHRFGFPVMAGTLAVLFLVLAALARALPGDLPRPERRELRLRWPSRDMAGPCLVLLSSALAYGALGTYTAQEALALGFRPLFGRIPTAAVFLTFMAIGMVIMRVHMGRSGFGARPTRLLPPMLWASGAGLAILALAPGGPVRHALAALVYGGGYSMVHTLVSSHVLDVTPAERRGEAFGATLFAFDAGIGLGSLIIGAIIGGGVARFGPPGFRLGWATAALFALAALPAAWRMARPRA